jgi:dolichol kinase
LAFATAVGLALLLAKAWLRIGGWPANNEDSWSLTVGKAGFAAGIASLTEAVLTGGNDNVVVPVILWLCVKGLDI